MYTTKIKWQPYTGIKSTDSTNRSAHFKSPVMADKFKSFVDAGLVSNDAGPNCYIQEESDGIMVCNATWTTLAAAQEWIDYVKVLPAVVSAEAGTVSP
jgi:hypothetical protein